MNRRELLTTDITCIFAYCNATYILVTFEISKPTETLTTIRSLTFVWFDLEMDVVHMSLKGGLVVEAFITVGAFVCENPFVFLRVGVEMTQVLKNACTTCPCTAMAQLKVLGLIVLLQSLSSVGSVATLIALRLS